MFAVRFNSVQEFESEIRMSGQEGHLLRAMFLFKYEQPFTHVWVVAGFTNHDHVYVLEHKAGTWFLDGDDQKGKAIAQANTIMDALKQLAMLQGMGVAPGMYVLPSNGGQL